jgi:hypothetical protein
VTRILHLHRRSARGFALLELLYDEGRKSWLWWVKGGRTDYRMQMLNDLDAKATREAVITKNAESGAAVGEQEDLGR